MSIEVFPVVHVSNQEQALEQSNIAFDSGADGVYLIDHTSRAPEHLLSAFNRVASEHPDEFVGLNFLGLGSGLAVYRFLQQANNAGALEKLPSGIWVDDAISGREELCALRAQDESLQTVRYLGGTAFKYTRTYTPNPEDAALQAVEMAPFVDVVTTSGAGTGKSPSPEKIAAMKRAIGEQQLAVASGIDVANIAEYAGSLDQVLVASSVETIPYSGIFDQDKFSEFIAAAHQL